MDISNINGNLCRHKNDRFMMVHHGWDCWATASLLIGKGSWPWPRINMVMIIGHSDDTLPTIMPLITVDGWLNLRYQSASRHPDQDMSPMNSRKAHGFKQAHWSNQYEQHAFVLSIACRKYLPSHGNDADHHGWSMEDLAWTVNTNHHYKPHQQTY